MHSFGYTLWSVGLVTFSVLSPIAQECMRWVKRTDVGSPGERRRHAMAYDSDRGVVVLFGGAAGDDYLQGTQEYDGQSWKKIRFAGDQPSHRAMHAMAYDPVRKQVLLCGGFTGGRFGHSDSWSYRGDGVNGFWVNLIPNDLTLPSFAGAAMVLDAGRNVLVRHGGNASPLDSGWKSHGGTWEWDGQKWNPAGTGPTVYGFGMAFDDRRGVAMTVGGFGFGDESDRTDHVWQFTPGAGWADLGATLPGRGLPATAYDSKRGRLVVVGGDGGQGNIAIEFDPAKGWMRLPDFPQVGRAGAAMVYDSKREKMILMGGSGAGLTFSDTWELEPVPLDVSLIAPTEDKLLCDSEPLLLYGRASDTRPLSYQWFINGKPLEGATQPDLTLPPFSAKGELSFQLKATDYCGNEWISPVLKRTVHSPPNISSFSVSRRELCPGDSLRFDVDAQSDLTMTYEWLFNDVPIKLPIDPTTGFRPARTIEPTLLLENVQPEDTGLYSVRVWNDCGPRFAASFRVQVGVTIRVQPFSAEVNVCKTHTLGVKANGIGTLRYQWRLDGIPLSNSTHYSGVNTDLLRIGPLLYTHEGNYDVVIADDCGPADAVISKVAKLKVKPGPEWVLRASTSPTTGPSARSGHAMAYDSARGVTVMFGGMTSGEQTLGDLWEWNGVRWTLRVPHSSTSGWINVPDIGPQPSLTGQPVHRRDAALAYDSSRGRFVLFGGESRIGIGPAGQIYHRDTWEWDGMNWTLAATNGPAARARAAMAYDSDRKVTVMTGGFLQGGPPDPTAGAVWEWNGQTWALHSPTNGPSTAHSQDAGGMTYDSFRKLTIFGPTVGDLFSAGFIFWGWNGAAWKKFDLTAPDFFLEAYGDLTFDSYRRRSVWFGGMIEPRNRNTGFFDATGWELLTTGLEFPSGRYHLALAYDSKRHATTMFGGETANLVFNGETWELIAVDVPLINEQPASQYAEPGKPVTLTTTAKTPIGLPVTYQWFRGKEPVENSTRIQGATTSMLRISSAQANDENSYYARVTCECGATDTVPAILTLNPALQIFPSATTTTLLWSNPAVVLEYSDSAIGPWIPVPGATPPFNPAAFGPAKFFRLRP